MQKWEYKIVEHVAEPLYNELGVAGWELVNIAVALDGGNGERFFGGVFKRPKH